MVGQISAQKNIHINERFKFQVRWDFQNFMKTWTFLSPTTTVDLQNPQTVNAMRVVVVLQTLLLAALWYAPLLVSWRGQSVVKAVFFSAVAAFINWRALFSVRVLVAKPGIV